MLTLAVALLIALSSIGNAEANQCTLSALVAPLAEDFPVERIYPNVKVEVGVTNRGSKAFVLWRQKTPPHIPDAAFNVHYYTEDQKLLAAGYGLTTIAAKSKPGSATELSSKAKAAIADFYAGGAKLYSYDFAHAKDLDLVLKRYPSEAAIKKFGSVGGMFEKLRINPRLTPEKLEQIKLHKFEGRYFIGADGTAYVLSSVEADLIGGALELPMHHASIADLIFESPGKKIEVIDIGVIIDGEEIFSFKQMHGTFDPEEYLLGYFGKD